MLLLTVNKSNDCFYLRVIPCSLKSNLTDHLVTFTEAPNIFIHNHLDDSTHISF